jgi:hypothetical protein
MEVKIMKKSLKLSFITSAIFLMSVTITNAQTGEFDFSIEVKENQIQKNDETNPCITAREYELIENRCAENAMLLNIHKSQKRQLLTTSLNWPLKTAAGFTDCSYYFIGAYVDQNSATGVFKDWNCGTRSYDGHGGTDIGIWPFPFNKVDSNSVKVIAATAGTIIDKHDGELDRNCVGVGSGLSANYIIIQHADGSLALYWHMKKNSITSKTIGQTVVVGEQIGVVASSGSSSGPHLHFEVWAGSTASTRIDPYYGSSCNLLNASSWWASQKPASEPAILKASVHITDYVPKACPKSDTTNESTFYTLPFSGPGMPTDYAKFFVFLRDVSPGSIVDMKILNPNGTTYNSWKYTFTGTFNVCYAGWSKHLPILPGVCTFQATYNGVTCSQNFTISTNTGISGYSNLTDIVIYPNPATDNLTIEAHQKAKIEILNTAGQIIKAFHTADKQISIDISDLSCGVYIIKVKTENGVAVKEFIKE